MRCKDPRRTRYITNGNTDAARRPFCPFRYELGDFRHFWRKYEGLPQRNENARIWAVSVAHAPRRCDARRKCGKSGRPTPAREYAPAGAYPVRHTPGGCFLRGRGLPLTPRRKFFTRGVFFPFVGAKKRVRVRMGSPPVPMQSPPRPAPFPQYPPPPGVDAPGFSFRARQ